MNEQGTLPIRVPGGRKPRPERSRRSPNRRYAFGAEAERRVRDKLRRLGYHVVRSAGSRGAVDLVCIGPSDVLMIQVKAGKNIPRPGERAAALKELVCIPTPKGATVRREVWWWDELRRCWNRWAA